MAHAESRSSIYRVIFLIVLAPVGAALIVLTLLVLGAEPHLVFILI